MYYVNEPFRLIDADELKNHKTIQERIWISAWGNVYDITDLLGRHPGGLKSLYYASGLDVTQFLETTHSERVKALLRESYFIGYLKNSAKTQGGSLRGFRDSSNDYLSIKKEIHAEMGALGIPDEGSCTKKTLVKLILLNIIVVLFRTVQLYFLPKNLQNSLFDYGFSLVNGILLGIYFLHSFHDQAHGVFIKSFGNTVANILKFTSHHVTGLSGFVYYYQHVIGHHQYSNHPNLDPDFEPVSKLEEGQTIAQAKKSVRYIHPFQQARWFHRYQHFYLWAMYGLVLFKWHINDLKVSLSTRLNQMIIQSPVGDDRVYMWSSKLFFFFYSLALPIYLTELSMSGVFRILLVHIMTLVSWSFYLTLLVQISHQFEGVKWQNPNQTVKRGWVEDVVVGTLDYAYDSSLVTFFTGGLNYQLIHHLFPAVAHEHLPKIAKTVWNKLEEKYGEDIVIHYEPKFFLALRRHWSFIRNMALGSSLIKK